MIVEVVEGQSFMLLFRKVPSPVRSLCVRAQDAACGK